jgi:hypothetical protein
MPFRSNLKFSEIGWAPSLQRTDDKHTEPEKPKLPTCPHCSIPMVWFQTSLKHGDGRSKLVHSFHCTNCARIITIDEPYKQALRLV